MAGSLTSTLGVSTRQTMQEEARGSAEAQRQHAVLGNRGKAFDAPQRVISELACEWKCAAGRVYSGCAAARARSTAPHSCSSSVLSERSTTLCPTTAEERCSMRRTSSPSLMQTLCITPHQETEA